MSGKWSSPPQALRHSKKVGLTLPPATIATLHALADAHHGGDRSATVGAALKAYADARPVTPPSAEGGREEIDAEDETTS